MNISAQSSRKRPKNLCAAVVLVECMMYIALVMLIVGLGLTMYLKLLGFHRDLERNNNDITRVLQAGELWRADIRSADSVSPSSEGDANARLELNIKDLKVIYSFENGTVWRKNAEESVGSPFLENVADCRFIKESREQVSAWRWELHLKTKKRVVKIEPLFSFLAVSTPQGKGDRD